MARQNTLEMRRLAPFAALLAAACASTPTPQPTASEERPVTTDDHDHRTLSGMTANELIEHFGKPRIQIREGAGTKLQFAGPACVLDAYLYPDGGGSPRVSYVEARNFQGVDISAQSCVYAIEARLGRR